MLLVASEEFEGCWLEVCKELQGWFWKECCLSTVKFETQVK